MFGRRGEQFCEQVLLRCLIKLGPFLEFADHGVSGYYSQNQSLFKNWCFYCRFKQYIYVSGQKPKKKYISMTKKTVFCYCHVTVCPLYVSSIHTGQKLVPGRRGTSFEMFSLNAGTQFLGKAKKLNNVTTDD